jgi:ABC-type nitrate/sulfonate/bicarbonate transport system substrate-binding protein
MTRCHENQAHDLCLCGPSVVGLEPRSVSVAASIRIGYSSISSRQAQLWVAKDEGIFRKHGLDVELIFLRGGQIAIQSSPAAIRPW